MAPSFSSSTTSCAALDASKSVKTRREQVVLAYVLFAGLAGAVLHFVAGGEFSAIVTLSVMFQCLAMLLLFLQSLSSGSSDGISARALALEAFSLCCRLSSTTWLDGYLPVDASGDWVFQATDACTLLLVLTLLARVLVVQRASYQASEDSFPCVPIVLGSLVLAAILHADLNSRPLFDAMWMAGLFVGVLAVIPQFWLISRTSGSIEALTSHFIAMMAMSRVLSGIFMWHVREDLTCAPWVGSFNHAVWGILGAHVLHLLLLADFVYYYAKSVATSGLAARVEVSLVDMV
mmetsp:Transcript_95545/g.265342  ORF Transcript_95545/g.265342 Transcript_95545/m.265342 type:complete len:291 (+) Transcript_95545:84-956(+)